MLRAIGQRPSIRDASHVMISDTIGNCMTLEVGGAPGPCSGCFCDDKLQIWNLDVGIVLTKHEYVVDFFS